ncbi:hypothetical protein RRF57_005959 [Xylaria bambusicola]|uniref:Uncharacterized protein n=1 Tax=Xylaria bambusicola TaxID=326684 RepID=A0AAN7YY75_9PEZI
MVGVAGNSDARHATIPVSALPLIWEQECRLSRAQFQVEHEVSRGQDMELVDGKRSPCFLKRSFPTFEV